MKKLRDFNARDEFDKTILLQDSWCDECMQADLGLIDPIEYEEDGLIYIEGKCAKCRNTVINQVIEFDFKE